ncbi:DUF2470 domain-containing protein [Nocardioides aequoreus]|uniref:DUF2470 domain-containing protein n=1 Tax=Nocardioides aequoreus TaxID=397278 RepID=UPI0004C45DFD|nr:DUF2470 domain-containing protein [Nocardioides aequoreus]
MHEPSAAERIRSMLAVSGDLRLQGPGPADPQGVARHVVLPDGTLLLAATPAVGIGDLATLLGTDVASVPQPDRVRGRFRMRGVVAPWTGPRPQGIVDHLVGPAPETVGDLVSLRPVSLELDWRCEGTGGSASEGWRVVDLQAYRAAAPDALVADERTWLPHLQRDHGDAVDLLAQRAGALRGPGDTVRALGLDRAGLVLRVYAVGGGHHDLRLPFPAPARCACAVREAFGELLGHAVTPRHGHA